MKRLGIIFLFLGIFADSAFASDVLPEKINVTSVTFHLQVNYNLPIESLVVQGNYGYVDSDITSNNFPTVRKGTAELDIVLVHLGKRVSSEDAIKELDILDLRPAELHELLSFGVKHLDEQRKHPIVALGSVWLGWWYSIPSFAYLSCSGGDVSDRSLEIFHFSRRWTEDFWFAGVRKYP